MNEHHLRATPRCGDGGNETGHAAADHAEVGLVHLFLQPWMKLRHAGKLTIEGPVLEWTECENVCTVRVMPPSKELSVEAYLSRLTDERCPLNLELSGIPIDFRPPLDWRVNLAGLPVHLFYLCQNGSFLVEVAGKTETIAAGEGIWISPGRAFRMSSPDPGRARLSRFRLELRDPEGRILALKKDYVRSAAASGSTGWLDVLRQECVFSSGAARRGLRCAVAGLLNAVFGAEQQEGPADSQGRKLSIPQVRTLQEWLHRLEPSRRPNSGDLAARLQLSRDYFNRLCRATFGMSAERWLIRQRVEAAAMRLVESDRRVSEVADEFGYRSLYFFSRQFRQVMGLSPSAYRARYHRQLD